MGEWSRNINTDPISKHDKDRIKGVQDLVAHLLAHQTGDPFSAMSEHYDPVLALVVESPNPERFWLQMQPEHGVGYTEDLMPMLPDFD